MSRNRSQFWIWFLGVTCVVLLAIFAAQPFAHGLVVLKEGFPAPVWPASGAFAKVVGADRSVAEARPSNQLNHWGRDLFEQSDGSALGVWYKGDTKLLHFVDGYDAQTRFNSYSLVKSLVGLLVLKATSEGRISSLEDPIGQYLPDFASPSVRARSIESFLTMRSGLDFERDSKVLVPGTDPKEKQSAHYNPFGAMAKLHVEGLEAVEDGLALTAVGAVDAAGETEFRYQNINTAILGHLLEVVFEQPLETILSEQIWRPSGAQDAYWRRYKDGLPVSGHCCLYATISDWGRVGRFIVANGEDGAPFLPQALWNRFFGLHLSASARNAGVYGDHVRQDVLNRVGEPLQGNFTYFLGNGGQTLYLLPQQELVVVRFGERLPLLHSTLYAAWRSISP